MKEVEKTSDKATYVDHRDVALRMKIDYSRGVRDQSTKIVEGACRLFWKLERPDFDQDAFMKEMVEMISRLFGLDGVAIAVRDPVDRLYKVRAVSGYDKETEEGYKKLAYTREQLLDPSVYPSYEISPHSRLFLAEDHPYAPGEEFTHRRPGLMGMKRRSLTDFVEADYLDSFFHGPDGEILGYIEISGTRTRKLPDIHTVKWMELLGVMLATALQRKR